METATLAMSSEESKSLHPFFSKPIQHTARSAISQLEPSSGARIDTTGVDEDTTRLDGLQSKKTRKRIPKLANAKDTDLEDAKPAAPKTLADYVIVQSKNEKEPSAEASGLDTDLNAARRKRRKTKPTKPDSREVLAYSRAPLNGPSEQASGKQHLRKSNRIQRPKNTYDDVIDESDPLSHGPAHASSLRTPPAQTSSLENAFCGPSTARNSGSGLLEVQATVEMIPASFQDAVLQSEPTTARASSKDMAPEKRSVLKLNGSGRFSPPLRKVHGAWEKNDSPRTPRKRGRPPKPKLGGRRLIVICRYGTDNTTRLTFGRRIEQIQDGTITYREHSALPAPAKPQGPPKPTHPFFMGNPRHDQSENQEATRLGASVQPGQFHSPGHKTSAITPGKLRLKVFASRADNAPNSGSELAFGVARDRMMVKHPGAKEAPWPTRDATHVRGDIDRLALLKPSIPSNAFLEHAIPMSRRKGKAKMNAVSDTEDILSRFSKHMDSGPRKAPRPDGYFDPPTTLRTPERLLTTGIDIQRMVRKQVHAPLCLSSSDSDLTGLDVLGSLERSSTAIHPLIHDMYEGIATTLTNYDQGKSEPCAWTHKYSPTRSSHVLQSGKEVKLLRDWMHALTIVTVEGSGMKGPKLEVKKVKKKRRKRAEDLDDFLVSDDELVYNTDELSEPENAVELSHVKGSQKRSVMQMSGTDTGKVTNAVLLSGPHGCGKTAAVYAVAKELGFEIFEINSGSRRSGKDVLDRIGNMTGNHLVQQHKVDAGTSSADEDLYKISSAFAEDLKSGRQGTMKGFFGASSTTKPSKVTQRSKKARDVTTLGEASNTIKAKKPRNQKQSLILLEEVDILFEEDKQFWMTVLTLITSSKRPVVMTCNDESLVPLEQLFLHAVFRFSSPPLDLATDYLLLMAAREGHLIEREAVTCLYQAKGHDLRASIMELNFHCQMAVGDPQGGLGWMFQRWPPGSGVDSQGRTLRVASIGTYQEGMGCFTHDVLASQSETLDVEEELLREAFHNWSIDPNEALQDVGEVSVYALGENDAGHELSNRAKLVAALERSEFQADCLSALDVYSFANSPHVQYPQDSTIPPLPEKVRSNYIERFPLLQTMPVNDYGELGANLAITTNLLLKRVHGLSPHSAAQQLHEDTLHHAIVEKNNPNKPYNFSVSTDFSTAFEPLSDVPINTVLPYPGPQVSILDGPLAAIATDVAPYVRSIVWFDLALEEQRLRLSNLLSASSGNGKRLRTTRAAWSALEGGKRESTRRERWFPKALNMAAVLRTGGKEWPKCSVERVTASIDGVSESKSVSGSVGGVDERRLSADTPVLTDGELC
ncbi:hypothetical protein LTR66_002916 [Elasticomyces elasticus]|nr:hypothetical protein LTR66_002916 [Elasticomyces elasticus]